MTEYIEFSLDGKIVYTVRPPPSGFVSMTDSPGDHPWRSGTNMAPFDQEVRHYKTGIIFFSRNIFCLFEKKNTNVKLYSVEPKLKVALSFKLQELVLFVLCCVFLLDMGQ